MDTPPRGGRDEVVYMMDLGLQKGPRCVQGVTDNFHSSSCFLASMFVSGTSD